MKDKALVTIIGGTTASGKSRAALALARARDGVVINADAMQIYRDLEILTARPPAADLAEAPHALYGILDGAERSTVARWRSLALAAIDAAHQAGRLPIVVGGTGLYLRALMQGLAPVPDVGQEIIRAALALYDEIGAAAFHVKLAACDREMAARLDPGDRQRTTRAYAVLEATGKSLAHWQRQPVAPPPYRFDAFVILPDRRALYSACDARFAEMMSGGAVDEVAALTARGLDPSLPVMKSLGVAEITGYIEGRLDRIEALAVGQQATRRYAKRQTTWFRNQLADAKTVSHYDKIPI